MGGAKQEVIYYKAVTLEHSWISHPRCTMQMRSIRLLYSIWISGIKHNDALKTARLLRRYRYPELQTASFFRALPINLQSTTTRTVAFDIPGSSTVPAAT